MNVFYSVLALALGGEISGLIETSGLVAKTVLVILLIFSLGSWVVIFSKWGLFRRARTQSNRFIRMFRKSERLNEVAAVVEQFKPSPLVAVFEGAYGELRKQTTYPIRMTALQRATQIAASEELTRLESRLPWLATSRRGFTFHRIVRNGLGHHRRISRSWDRRLRNAASRCARRLGSADHDGCWTFCRHSRRHRLQPVHAAHSRVRRAHGRLQPGAAQRSGASASRSHAPTCSGGAAVMAFTNAQGRTQSSLADINVTPLVDVVLVLLIIFMVTAPVLQSGIEVNVPHTKTVKEITEERLVITIDRDQNVFLNSQPININQIGQRIREKVRDPEGQAVYLRADENVPFGAFATVMDAVKQSGITNVSIVTQPLETHGSRR